MHDLTWPADPLAAVTHADPYPYYAALAARPTLDYDERLQLWVAAPPALVREVFAHADCHVRPVHEPVPAAIAGSAGNVFGALVRMNDGERHAAPKAALQRALAALPQEVVAARAARVAASMAAARIGDARGMNDFVSGVPVRTMASLLGFSDLQLTGIARATGKFVACLSPLATAAQIAAAHRAADELLVALDDVEPGPLLAGEWDDPQVRRANLLGLLSQTYEATAGLLGNSIVALLRGADRAGVVQRTMRADPSIHNTRRFAACDLSLGGAHVKQGQGILLVLAPLGAAHGFGHGGHACPGRTLAETIVTQAIGALPGHLQTMDWRYRPSLNARLPEFVEVMK